MTDQIWMVAKMATSALSSEQKREMDIADLISGSMGWQGAAQYFGQARRGWCLVAGLAIVFMFCSVRLEPFHTERKRSCLFVPHFPSR